jgi:Zn-dependent metalloprotease
MNNNRILATLCLFVLVLALAAPGPVFSAASPPDGLAALRAQSEGAVIVRYHAATGKVRFIGTDGLHPIQPSIALAPQASPETAARQFLAEHGPLFGLKDQARELTVLRERAGELGGAMVRFQQVYQGVPVFGGELIVQTDAARNVVSASGEVLPDIALAVTPAVSAEAARQAVLSAIAKWQGVEAGGLSVSEPEVWIYNPALVEPWSGPTRLVWRMEVSAVDLTPIRELVLVDAQRGSIALHFNQIDTAKNRVIYDNNNDDSLGLPGNGPERIEGGAASGIADVNNAYDYAGDTYDFYFNTHARDSLDGAGMTLTSTTRYCDPAFPCPYQNAFWNGVQMVYGEGFASADDVVGHELTHGVTEFESGLLYYYQSGAINESFSDVWGEFVDLTNTGGNDTAGVRWKMGEDVPGYPNGFRNMQDPTLFGDPDKMTSPNYYTTTCGNAGSDCDNGGVHINSGVNNKAVYLLVDGGSFNGQTVSALGITKTATIYYAVQTGLLTSGADYADLYDALYQACTNLVGTAGITSGDCQEVRDAANAVEMNLQPISGYNPEADLCPPGQTITGTVLFEDDFESGTGNWSFGAVTGSSRWVLDDLYFAHSGSNALLGNDYPDAPPSDSFAAMNASVALPANAYLHFAHAYGFENGSSSYFDGGVLEYSTNGGVNWSDAGALIQANGYGGTISALGTNPLGGRSAFVADSHGYISSRVNLSSLAGQSVRFRWRMGLDDTIFDMGWWVDDVQIYTCSGAAPTNSTVYLPLVTRAPAWVTLVNEGFEGAFPGVWQVSDQYPGTGEFYWAKRNCVAYAGSYSGWAVGGGAQGGGLGCGANYPNDADSWMVYGPFSLVGATAADVSLKLWQYSEPGYDYTCRLASTNGAQFSGVCAWGNSGGWVGTALDLSAVPNLGNTLGQPNVWIAFYFYSDYSVNYAHGSHVDNIVLRKCAGPLAACPASDVVSSDAAASTLVERPFSITLPVTTRTDPSQPQRR